MPTYAVEIVATAIVFVPIFIYGRKWNSEKRVLIDKATGREITFRARHSAFGIPMQHWAVVWPLIIAAFITVSMLSKQGAGPA